MQGFRFVVAFRPELRAAKGSKEVWRGWIEQVFPTPEDGASRKAFNELSEVSSLIETAVEGHKSKDKDDD